MCGAICHWGHKGVVVVCWMGQLDVSKDGWKSKIVFLHTVWVGSTNELYKRNVLQQGNRLSHGCF